QTRTGTERRRSEAATAVRHDEQLLRRVREEHLPRALRQLRIRDDRKRRAEGLHRHALRRVREGLRGPCGLSWYIGGGWHGHFDDWIDRLPVLAVEEVQKAVLAAGTNALDGPRTEVDVEENRPGDEVPVPEIVVNRLVVPDELSRLQIQRQDGVGEEVDPLACSAFVIGRGI